jgi:RNA polymerase primary sigma factor
MNSNLAMIARRPRSVRSGRQVSVPKVSCEPAKYEIDGRCRVSAAPTQDGKSALAESSGAGHVVEMCARRILEKTIRFVGHSDFEDSTAAAGILGPRTGPIGQGEDPDKDRAPAALPFSDADFQDGKFLTREQEVHLFRKMNFLKYQAAQLQEAINPSRSRAADLDRVEELLLEAGAIRNRIIRSYLGLVVSIAKKFTGNSQDFLDLVSEGNVSLILASEKFDFGRGIRFSTYASCVIFNNFVQRFPRNRHRSARFATGRDDLLQTIVDHRESGRADAADQEQSRYMIREMLGSLSGREQTIVVRRFGLAGDKQTLAQIGQELGLSKERIRQLEARALDKLRALAMTDGT